MQKDQLYWELLRPWFLLAQTVSSWSGEHLSSGLLRQAVWTQVTHFSTKGLTFSIHEVVGQMTNHHAPSRSFHEALVACLYLWVLARKHCYF